MFIMVVVSLVQMITVSVAKLITHIGVTGGRGGSRLVCRGGLSQS